METNNEQSEDRLTVIGIGASAGGLQALQAFFEVLPADTGMSFVVIMHLSPEHESLLAELLQAKTRMPVRQVTERIALFGGRMEIDSSPGQGTRVTIYTPIAVQSLPTSDTSDLPAPSRV
jgi:chemotaxis response regulator CheB